MQIPVAQYAGYNGHATHSTYNCQDPSKNLDGFPDGISRHRYGFFEKVPDGLDVSKVQQDLPGENPHLPHTNIDGECKSSRSSESEERLKPDPSEQLEHVPHIRDVSELKTIDYERQHSDLSLHTILNMKRDLSPPNEAKETASQDSFVGSSHHRGGMVTGHSENDYLPGTNEDGRYFSLTNK